MPFVPDSSRIGLTNPTTAAQVRAALGKLNQQGRADKDSITALEDDVELLKKASTRKATADEALVVGDVLRLTSATTVAKAQADAIGTSDVCGVCVKAANANGPTEYRPLGVVEKEGWGLTVGAAYYLSAATAGALVTAPDVVTAGAVSIIIGVSLSTTELLVNPQQLVLL